jgi:hypothetical protein
MNANKIFKGIAYLAGTYMILQAPASKGILTELFRGAQRNVEALYGRSNTIQG